MKKMTLLARVVIVFVTALSTTSVKSAETNLPQTLLDSGFAGKHIVVFEPDIELQLVLASGRLETRADWSELGKAHTEKWVSTFFEDSGIDFSEFVIPEDESGDRLRQIMALHRVVGFSIMDNALSPLPTKKGSFDWTIGRGASEIGESTNADYGMFIFYRRGYATAGRVATALVGAYFGVAMPSVYQVGFVTLVDLKTGNFVWFEQVNNAWGDLRKEEDAPHTVASMLDDFPGLILPEKPKPKVREDL